VSPRPRQSARGAVDAPLAPGARRPGAAEIAEDETSTVMSPLFDAHGDRLGYIELIRRQD
jgi:hypothetical protein